MIHISSNAATLATVAAKAPKAFQNGLNRGMAFTMQQGFDTLRSHQFLAGVSAQLVPSRQSPGLGLSPQGSKKQGDHYAFQLEFAQQPLRYSISTDFIGASVHEFGAVIKAKNAKYLKFQVPESRTQALRGNKPLKKPKVTGWRWVQVKEVTIPSRPAWRTVKGIVERAMEANVVRFVSQELNKIFHR
jgi:hypothetical protein